MNGQWQSFTGMEPGTQHARAVYTATGLERDDGMRELVVAP